MRIKLLFIGILIVGGLLFVETAYAHSAYLRSNPGLDAVISSSPSKVDIWFSQELFRRAGENTIHVSGPQGQEVSTGETQFDEDDRKHIWVNLLPDLPAGKYLVEWRNLSVEDGHPTEGSFNFMIDPQAAMTSTPMEEATEVAALTNTPLPQPTQVDLTPQPAPTTVSSPQGAPAPANNLLATGLALVVGILLVAFYFTRRFRRK